MARMIATYSGNEIEASFTANAMECDYGVPGSPVWSEPVDIELTALTILGVEISDWSRLPEKLMKEILALGDDLEFAEDEE